MVYDKPFTNNSQHKTCNVSAYNFSAATKSPKNQLRLMNIILRRYDKGLQKLL